MLHKLVLLLLWVGMFAGCQNRPEGRVVARGVIQLSDGTPLTGTAGMVTFCPIDPDKPYSDAGLHAGNLPGQRCVGWITPEGTFELATDAQGDGTEPANYKVFLNVDNIQPGPSRVPGRFTEYLPSPWVVEIKPEGENFFELKMEIPEK